MVTKISLDIIIVNWNSGDQLFNCLKSLEILDLSGIVINNVTVVDNASTDRSLVKTLSTKLPLKVISNSENIGFAAACNQGCVNSDADYLLFLNPDTIAFEKSIIQPIEFLNQSANSQVGICGIQLLDDNGNVSRSCSRFPTPSCHVATAFGGHYLFPKIFPKQLMTEWDHTNSSVVDQVMGAFFLVRRSVFDELSGFDERFFVYFEEVDLALRAKSKGWNSYYLSTAQIYHRGGGTTASIRGLSLFYYLRSRILYMYKHFDFITATLLLICTLIVEPFSRIAQSIVMRSQKEFFGVLSAYKHFYLWYMKSIIIRQ